MGMVKMATNSTLIKRAQFHPKLKTIAKKTQCGM
jgi:hypothetical protein